MSVNQSHEPASTRCTVRTRAPETGSRNQRHTRV